MPSVYGAGGRIVDWRCPVDIPLDLAAKKYMRQTPEHFFIDCFDEGVVDLNLKCLEEDINRMRMMNDTYTFLALLSHSTERMNTGNNLFQLHSYANEVPVINQWQFVDLMGDIFRVMFEPVLALTQSINDTMTSLGLKENEYASVHVRARYPV